MIMGGNTFSISIVVDCVGVVKWCKHLCKRLQVGGESLRLKTLATPKYQEDISF